MTDRRVIPKSRMGAFSDAVLAIVNIIMSLEIGVRIHEQASSTIFEHDA